jgi:hypothetical protein
MDKTTGKGMTYKEAEKNKIFTAEISYSQRLAEAWYLTCMAYGIDPENPPRMEKNFTSSRKRSE